MIRVGGTAWETVIVDLQQVGGPRHGSTVAVEGGVAALLRSLQAKRSVVVVGCEGVAELDGPSCAALLELFVRKGEADGRGGRGKTKASRSRAKRSAAAASGTAEDEGKQSKEEEEDSGSSLRADLASLSEDELRDPEGVCSGVVRRRGLHGVRHGPSNSHRTKN